MAATVRVERAADRWPVDGSRPASTTTYRNLGTAALYEHALRRSEGRLAATGPLVVDTGEHTGRSPRDKFVVQDETTADVWWGEVN